MRHHVLIALMLVSSSTPAAFAELIVPVSVGERTQQLFIDIDGNPARSESFSLVSSHRFGLFFGVDSRIVVIGTIVDAALEFDLSSIVAGEPAILSLPVTSALLNNSVFPGISIGIDIQGYAGDGVVTLDDFHRTDYVNLGGVSVESGIYNVAVLGLDVTSFVDSLITSGAHYVGFRLEVEDAGLGVNGPISAELADPRLGPMLAPVPEPSSLVLGFFGAMSLVGRAMRSSKIAS
jgi:hypothetical protein